LAVQGASREGTFCERCFAPVGKEETYCPECGAPIGEATPAAESVVHGELAQANLLRLRGEFDASEKALLTVLRRFPNDPHAHEMLGDVCADRGEGARAVEWYELALDLAPNTPDVRRKLVETRDRLDERETADTAEQIGLPPAAPSVAWWPLAASGAILVLAILVAAWPRNPAPGIRQATVVAPASEASVVAPNSNPATAVTTDPAVVPNSGTEQDHRLLADLQKLPDGARAQSVVTDPRGRLDVTFELADTDDPKSIALALGKAALGIAPTATTVTLRAVRSGALVFTADISRATMESIDPLTNVWPSATTEAPATVGSEPGTGATGGTTTTGTITPGTTPSGSAALGASAGGTETTSGAAAPSTAVPSHGSP